MPIKASVTGNTWPLSGTATAGTTGLNAISGTNLVHVASTDLPAGSLATGYITGDDGTSISVTLDDPATILSTSDVYTLHMWVRHRLNGAPPAAGIPRRILDLNGNGIRCLVELYTELESVITPDGLQQLVSPITGTGTLRRLNTASVVAGILPYNQWARFSIEVDGTTSNGALRFYIDNNLVAEWTGISNTGKDAWTEAATMTFGFAGVQVDICGPIISETGTDLDIVPLDKPTASDDLVRQLFPIRYADAARGTFWSATPTTTSLAVTPYTAGGGSPYRQRAIMTGAGSCVFKTKASLGTLPYNETGWATIVIPAIYLPGTSAAVISLRNAADTADAITLTLNTNVVLGADTIVARDPTRRNAVLLHVHQSGAVHCTITDQTTAANETRVWSGRMTTQWTPQTLGPIKVTVTVNSTAEFDGCYVCRWADLVGIDSLVAGAALSVTPAFYHANRMVVTSSPFFTDNHSLTCWRGLQDQNTQWGVIIGRPGQTSSQFAQWATPGLEHSRGIRLVLIDGGSINDITGITDANRRSSLSAWIDRRSALVARTVAVGNRIYLTTMVRREQGTTYSAVQNRQIGLFSAANRAIASTQQRITGGIALIELSDPALEIDDHSALYTSGDDTHPTDPAGGLIVSKAMKATRTTDTGAIAAAASIDAIITAQNADATQAAARAAAITAASAATSAPADTVTAIKADPDLGTADGGMVAEVNKIPRAASAVTAGAAQQKHLENSLGATLQTVYEVHDGDVA